MDKQGYLKKSQKSTLGISLLEKCPSIDTTAPKTMPTTHAAIIDFMAFVRKFSVKMFDEPIKTFGEFAKALTISITPSQPSHTTVSKFILYLISTTKTVLKIPRDNEEKVHMKL